jgi:DNA-binding MarR family transcriptional regulator
MSVETEKREWVPLPALLERASEVGYDELHRRLAERGHTEVRHAHGCVFRYVQPDGMRLTQLAECAGHTKQAVGEFVCDLEEKGYAERIPDPHDRRAKLIRLTERGAEVRALALEVFAEIEREWGEAIGDERVEALRDALERMQEAERPAVVR